MPSSETFISHLKRAVRAAHMNVFAGVSSTSSPRFIVALMRRDSFYFVLALAGLVIVVGWLTFVILAE